MSDEGVKKQGERGGVSLLGCTAQVILLAVMIGMTFSRELPDEKNLMMSRGEPTVPTNDFIEAQTITWCQGWSSHFDAAAERESKLKACLGAAERVRIKYKEDGFCVSPVQKMLATIFYDVELRLRGHDNALENSSVIK